MQSKRELIEERVVEEAKYIITNRATVRATAQACNKVSKSTVYKDVTERLKEISLPSYTKVQKILQDNKEERAVRGGMATRQKYLNMKNWLNIFSKKRVVF